MKDRAWPFVLSLTLNLFVIGINLGVVAGDLIARRFTAAGYQGFAVVFVAFVIYAMRALDDRRIVWMDQARSALACSEKNLELRTEMLAAMKRGAVVTIDDDDLDERAH